MKAPVLFVVSALYVGILSSVPVRHPVSAWAGAAFVSFIAASLLLALRHRKLALLVAAVAWLALGGLSVAIERTRARSNLVSSLAANHRIDLSDPVRWRGWLRSDPEHLPYGWRFEIDLEAIELRAGVLPVTGGMRATYYESARPLPEALRAGDEVELIAKATVPHNYADPGAFDYRAQLARQGIDVTASLRSLALIHATAAQRRTVRAWLARTRGRLLAEIDQQFGAQPRDAAILRAMLLGDRSFIDTEVAEEFQKTSSFHVLVVAGLHVAALAAFVFWIARRFRLGKGSASLAALIVVVAYLGIAQDRPPILRASLMAAVYLLAAPLYRRIDSLQTVALAAIAILIWRPSELVDPSFQFSFLAVGAIAAIGAPWLARTSEPLRRALAHVSDVTRDPAFAPKLAQLRLDLRALAAKLARTAPGHPTERGAWCVAAPLRCGVVLFEAFAISVVIQFGLLPLSVGQYHRVSAVGAIANISALFFTSVIVPLGFVSLAAGAASHAATKIVAAVLRVLVGSLLGIVHAFATPSWSSQRVPDAPAWLIALYFALLLALAISIHICRRTPERVALAATVTVALAIVIHPFAPSLGAGELETTVLDVGQGDSIFLATPTGRTVLIDGGGTPGAFRIGGMRTRFDIGEEVVSRYLWSRGIKTLDAIALTHAHEDHLEGLSAVLENFRVGELWVGHDVASAAYRHLVEIAQRRGTKIVRLKADDDFSFGGADVEVLWPSSDAEVAEAHNDDSLVLRVKFGDDAIFLAGDIEHGVETQLSAGGRPLSADFLKVAHHGSKTSSTSEFLSKVSPSFAAISVGENNAFGHPSEITLEHLREAHAEVLRTDRDGAITYRTDGKIAQVFAYRRNSRSQPPNTVAHLAQQFHY